MRIYLAARYIRRDELRVYRRKLRALGHIVTSRWLDERKSPKSTVADVSVAHHVCIAQRDLADIDRADVFVLFAAEHQKQKRGGHWVEMGYALAAGKKIIVLEELENTFCFLPGVQFFKNFEEFLNDRS